MTADEKNRLFKRFPYLLVSNNIEDIHSFHRMGQRSIRLHCCAHLCYARYYAINGVWKDSLRELWRLSCAPIATVSIRLGLNSKRRFFGFGPYR